MRPEFEYLLRNALAKDNWRDYTYPKAPCPKYDDYGYRVKLPPLEEAKLTIVRDREWLVRVYVQHPIPVCAWDADRSQVEYVPVEIHEVEFNVGFRICGRDFSIGLFVNQLDKHKVYVFIRESDWRFVR